MVLMAVIATAAASGFSEATTRREQEISRAIRSKYEAVLYTLEPNLQRHWGERMYRITGDTTYIYPVLFGALVTARDLEGDDAALQDSTVVGARNRRLLEYFNARTRKGRLRRELFEQSGHVLFNLNLLESVYRLKNYQIADRGSDDAYGRALEYLRGVDFTSFLLDADVLRVYGPQAVNAVYYLHYVGLTDLRRALETAIRRAFSDESDKELSNSQFEDKVYVLTHLVIAASNYYQQLVDTAGFLWVLDYFTVNADRIFKDTKADVIAEVGICFLLTGRRDHELVTRCRNYLVAQFNDRDQMIHSPSGKRDLIKGEHRNILTYMLLNWPDVLHPGPSLEEIYPFGAQPRQGESEPE